MNEGWGVGDQADAKAFDKVLIGNQEYDLIHGQYPHSRRDNTDYARSPSGNIIDFDGFRRLIDIDIKSSNYMKESDFSGDEVRKSVIGSIIVDGVKLVEVFGRDPIDTMRNIERLIIEYSEHPSGWFNKSDREKMLGRKIWYHDQPATIERLVESQNAIVIRTEPGFKPPKRGYDDDEDEYDYWDDWKVGDHYEVKDEVLSPYIWWWRD